MCAIIGSRDIEILKDLIKLNSYRGSESYSFSWYNVYFGSLVVVDSGKGSIDIDKLMLPSECYGIVHVQAPTSGLVGIHPAVIMEEFYPLYTPDYALWHNGIIKADIVQKLKEELGYDWDTMQMLSKISKSGSDWFNVLNEFDGTFSCLYYRRPKSLYLFRNQISPMFMDSDLNISSTRFEGSHETEHDVVWKMDLINNKLVNKGSFKTVENPYFFGE